MATKQLAMELGLVQKRKIKSGQASVSKDTQVFEYLVVLDFESTCWENGLRVGRQEIIEFPAVLLHLPSGEILSEFHHYVMPVEQPILSEFCIGLTGITQAQVEAGIPIGTCLGMFSSWIRKLCDQYQMSFNTETAGKHATFATWSDWDLGVCLLYECSRKQLKKPEFFNQWIDVRATYKNYYQRRPQGLAGAMQDLGISFEGREHSGICDTRNTAVLISRMARDGCVLKITKTISTKVKDNRVKEAAQNLFKQVKNIVFGKRAVEDDQSGNKRTKLPDSSASKTSAVSNDLQSERKGQNINLRQAESSTNKFDTKANDIMRGNILKPPLSNIPVRPVINAERKSILPKASGTTPKLLSFTKTDPFKTPHIPTARYRPIVNKSSNVNTPSISNVSANSMNRSSNMTTPSISNVSANNVNRSSNTTTLSINNVSVNIGNRSSNMTTPSICNVSANTNVNRSSNMTTPSICNVSANTNVNRSSNMTTPSISNVSTNSVNRSCNMTTPSTSNVSANSVNRSSISNMSANVSGMSRNFHRYKRTPPFCGCGRRAKLLLTCKPGPNEGRYFFSCPNGGGGSKKRCGYFKWEEEPFVKNALITSFQTPAANGNSKCSVQSLPLQRTIKSNPIPIKGPVSEPVGNNRMRCIGLSRKVLPTNSSQGKTPLITSNLQYNGSMLQVNENSNTSCEVTPYVLRNQSKVRNIR